MIHLKNPVETVLKPSHPSLIKFPFGKGTGNFIEIKIILEFATAVTLDALNPRIALGGCLVRFMNSPSDLIEDFIHYLKRADWIISRNL